VYRQSALHLALLNRSARASQLELTAHQFDCHSLAARIASAVPGRPWRTHWCHGHQVAGHQILTGHIGKVRAVATGALPDGTPVIVSGGDTTVRVWRLADGTRVREQLTSQHPVDAVAVGALPDGTPIIVSADSGAVRVWRLTDGTPVAEQLTAYGWVHAVAVAVGALPDGTPVIITVGGLLGPGTVRVWRLTDNTSVAGPPRGHIGEVCAVATGALRDGTPVWEQLTGHGMVQAVAVGMLADGTPIIVSADSGAVRVWRLADGTPAVPLLDLTKSVHAVAVHGNVIVTAAGADIAVHQPALPRPMR
jgi:WD40 repeat protein